MGQEDIGERIATFLGEFRIMVPALGALLGFQLMAAFQASYEALPMMVRGLHFLAVACSTLAVAFALVPSSYHRLTSHAESTEEFLAYAQRNIGYSFAFLAASLSASVYLQALRSFGDSRAATVAGALTAMLLGLTWFVLPRRRAAARGHDVPPPAGASRDAGERRRSA